jgi:hypothetical protein
MGNHPAEEPAETPARRWPVVFSWLGVLVACLALCEMTNYPAVATALLCVKAGFDDFRTANWLRRRDPVPERGRATWWLYVARGFGVSGIVAVAVSLIVVVVGLFELFWRGGVLGPWWDRILWTTAGALVPGAACALLSSLAFRVALFQARRNHLSLWLHGAILRARERDTWPPSKEPCGRRNLLTDYVVVSGGFGTAPLVLALAYFLFDVVAPVWFGATCMAAALLLGAAGSVEMLRANKLSAASAAECWPLDEP